MKTEWEQRVRPTHTTDAGKPSWCPSTSPKKNKIAGSGAMVLRRTRHSTSGRSHVGKATCGGKLRHNYCLPLSTNFTAAHSDFSCFPCTHHSSSLCPPCI